MAQREWPLLGSIATTTAFLAFGQRWLADLSNPIWFAFVLVWLFGVVLFSAFAVVRHAEVLAVKLGEPLGTLVLTLSVTGIEVMMIAAVMYTALSLPRQPLRPGTRLSPGGVLASLGGSACGADRVSRVGPVRR